MNILIQERYFEKLIEPRKLPFDHILNALSLTPEEEALAKDHENLDTLKSLICEARELYILCRGPETFEEMKTYSEEEWKNSLHPQFISKARAKKFEELDNKYSQIQ